TAGHRPAAVAKTSSKAGAGAHAERAAPSERTAHPERPASAAAHSAHGANSQSAAERIRPAAVRAQTAADEHLADTVQAAANDADEGDSSEPGSLLAGPRNVK